MGISHIFITKYRFHCRLMCTHNYALIRRWIAIGVQKINVCVSDVGRTENGFRLQYIIRRNKYYYYESNAIYMYAAYAMPFI